MPEYAAITPDRHSKKVWKPVTNYGFIAAETIIPLVVAEMSKTAAAMPTGFIKQDAGYQLVGITSLQSGLNLYVAPDGKWLGSYIPAALRAYPFRLLKPESSENSILCIDEASGLVVESAEDGNAFFDDKNQPTQGIKDILNLLSEVEANRAVTQQAVNALDAAGLINPWELNLKQGEEIVPVTDLFHVDKTALNKLDDDAFLTLRKSGSLVVAYAQLLSMDQLHVLESLGQYRGQILAQQATKSGASSLEGFSLSEEDGSLTFD